MNVTPEPFISGIDLVVIELGIIAIVFALLLIAIRLDKRKTDKPSQKHS